MAPKHALSHVSQISARLSPLPGGGSIGTGIFFWGVANDVPARPTFPRRGDLHVPMTGMRPAPHPRVFAAVSRRDAGHAWRFSSGFRRAIITGRNPGWALFTLVNLGDTR